MEKNSKRFIKILVIVALLFVVVQTEILSQNEASLVKTGDVMPEFKLESAKGIIHSADLKGKVVLINFFATWCPPCKKELPYIEKRIWAKHKENPDFKLLIVGRNHTQKEMDKFKGDKFGLPFYPDKDRGMYSKFALSTIPRNYIVGKSGKIIYSSLGFSLKDFEEMIIVLEKELAN